MTSETTENRPRNDTLGVRAEPAAEESGTGRWVAVGLALAALGSGAVFWLVHGALIDDAYITLSYARNVARDLHWGLIAEEVSNAATSPLNVLLLAAATVLAGLFGQGAVAGLGIVFVGASTVTCWWWFRITRATKLPGWTVVLGVGTILLNPFVLSASGLEVLLIAAVLVGMLAAVTRREPLAFGVLSGVAVLVRLDLALFVLVMGLVLLRAVGFARFGRGVLAGVGVALPWYLFSWVHFGSAIPDTFVIKTLQGSFGSWTFFDGPLYYYTGFPLATVVSFGPAALGLVGLACWLVTVTYRRLRSSATRTGPSNLAAAASLGTGGVVYYAAYSLLGVPPYQWYFVPTIVSLSCLFTVLVGAVASAGNVSRLVSLPLVATASAGLVLGAYVDLEQGLPWRTPVIFGNWATPDDYARVGRQLADQVGDATVIAPPEIGTLAYFCDCAIVDAFADRGRVAPLIRERIDNAGPVGRALLELNYLWFDGNQSPRPAQFRLLWQEGPAPAGQPRAWTVRSPRTGVNHLRLVPVDGPSKP